MDRNEDLLYSLKGAENSLRLAQNPIFVVGFPRSGTTLVQAMVSTQGNVHSFPETHFFSWIVKELEPVGDKVNGVALRKLIQAVEKNPSLDLPIGIKKWASELDSDFLIKVRDLFELIVLDYLKEAGVQTENTRWLEKTPAHVFRMREILDYYPNARFIYTVRNPFNAIYSCKKNFPGHKNTDVSELANRWNSTVEEFLLFKKVHPTKIFLVKYEDLVRDPFKTVGDLCEFLEILPNLDRLERFNEISEKHILPFETWKKANTGKLRTENLPIKWSVINRIKILFFARGGLTRLKYKLTFFDSLIVKFPYWIFTTLLPLNFKKRLRRKMISAK